jgi:hypothetical protein
VKNLFAGLFVWMLLGCDVPETAHRSTAPAQQSTSSIHQDTSTAHAEPAAPSSIDLFESLGGIQDGKLTIHCYGFSRVESREVIIEQAKALVKTMKPGEEVAYIFNVKKGVDDFIEARRTRSQFSPKLEKWMRASHFAQISYMNNGNEGSRWELIPSNKVAERKFNNRMESIPLSDAVPQ